MGEFISQPVDVQMTGDPGVPVSFAWRGLTLRVVEVLEQWQDWGFGATHPAARNWRTRRHRNYYRVRAEDGHVYELYLDRGAKERRWYLYRRLE
ncbi:MAG: DUF6504 family protein [Betaproteobacteria bacterium]